VLWKNRVSCKNCVLALNYFQRDFLGMWGTGTIPAMEEIKEKYPEVQIEYEEAA